MTGDLMTDLNKLKPFLIDPDNLETYLSNFPNYKQELTKNLANEKFWKGKRVMITGITGFVGSHLTDKLLELGAEVSGIVRRHSVPEYPNINHAINKIKLTEGNLTDCASIINAINAHEPDVIFHLAAQSFVPTSFRCPIETLQTNIIGTANVLEAVRKSKADIKKIHIALSSEEYGDVKINEAPIKETNELRPMSPYGASKVGTEMVAIAYHKSYGTPVVLTRGFNHTGSRRGLQFVASVVSRQAARCVLKGDNTITIGYPDSIRDFTDIRDMLQGYLLAVEKAKISEPYNIGHGFGITIGNLAKLAGKVAGLKEVKIKIDKSRFRPSEVEILLADYSKAKKEIGYRPRIPLIESLSNIIERFKQHPELLDLERH